MATIVTDQPSTGKPVTIRSALLSDAGPVVLWEANDFAVPPIDDTDNPAVPTRDIDGITRQIVPGETLFVTPLTVSNLTSASGTIRLSIKDESGGSYYLTHAIVVPGNDTVELPIQGKSLVKVNAGSLGEQLIAEVSAGAQFSVYAQGSEAQAGSHAYDTEGTF
jgi:hypothetical protein